ncbi:MAG TPA: response regulator [Actinomycetes bacterium]|jgi:two-component system, cell cycle response regulator|nr:response regulator [Actinomycetes bacterium]
MTAGPGFVLVVDDDGVNRLLLSRALERDGHQVRTAANGLEALEALRDGLFDCVLLDVLMPEIDGYQVLEHMRSDPKLRRTPVIMISALEDVESVVRCIEMGAEDYLPKPFDPVLLRARIKAGLARKRLDDLEQEYLEQVGQVVVAAAAVEAGTFERTQLDGVASRDDALGQLARVFQQMATEVRAREQRLKREVRKLRIEIDEARAARQVAEITETEYFQDLQRKVSELRLGPDSR